MDLYKLEVTLIDRNKKLQVNLDNLTNLRLNEENLKDENFNESTKENKNSSLFNENEELLLNYSNLYLNNNILENISIKDEGKFPEINTIEKSTEKQENSKNFKNLKEIFDYLKNNQETVKFKNIIIKELNDSDEFFIEFIHTVLFLHLHEFSSILDMPDIFYEGVNKKKEFLAKLFLDTEEGLYNKLKKGDFEDSLIEFESTLKYFRTKVDPWIKTDEMKGGAPGDDNVSKRSQKSLREVVRPVMLASALAGSDKDIINTLESIYRHYEKYENYHYVSGEIKEKVKIDEVGIQIEDTNYKIVIRILMKIIDQLV